MKKFFKSTLAIASVALMMSACEGSADSLINDRLEDNPLPTPATADAGNTDFSTYVAIGNSITAGYMDGALYNNGQQNSYPALMAEQFAKTSATFSFNQPDINSVDGFNTNVTQPGNGVVLGRFKLDTSIPGPTPTIDGDPIAPYNGDAVHNFGVPGIVTAQLLTPATGGPASAQNPAYNPFYARFAADAGTSTILGEAVAAQPTFFSLWIGNNDVLGYAAGGASNPAILTAPGDFSNQFGAVVDGMMNGTQADGIVANIPPILGFAYFRAVAWNAIPLDEATANTLNAGLASVNGAIQACANAPFNAITPEDAANRQISYSAGNNPILVADSELTDLGTCFDTLLAAQQISAAQRAQLAPYEQSRPLTQGELVVLTAGTVLNTEFDGDNTVADTPIGIVIPLGFNADGSLSGDQYYLTLAEQLEIETARAQFNGAIATKVGEYSDRLVLFDTNAPDGVFLDLLGLSDGQVGITVEGINLEADFSPNGVLSTDGIHPNPRGMGLIANAMLAKIEAKFGASLPSVSVTNLPSVTLCVTGDCVSEQ